VGKDKKRRLLPRLGGINIFNNETPAELMDELDELKMSLEKKNQELEKMARSKATANRDYKIALNKKILELRLDKQPATLVSKIAEGDEEVAQLAFEKEIEESLYFIALESLDNIRNAIDITRSKLSWHKVELGNS